MFNLKLALPHKEGLISVGTASEEKKLTLSGEQADSQERSWLWLIVCLLVPVVAAAVRWILDHPYGIHWDEALYFNNVLIDLQKFHSGSWRKVASILIGPDGAHPPGNLLLALPFLAVLGFRTAIARLVTLACWGVSGGILYFTTRRIASPAAGAVAVLVFCLSPEVVSASIFFSTEGPFYLATAVMLYFVSFYWSNAAEPPRGGWIGLGLAIGLGVLAKSSFVLIAAPVLAATLFLAGRQRRISALFFFFKAGAVGFLVAAPWWMENFRFAANYTKFAREQPRNSLGPVSLLTWAKWFFTVVVSLIGPSLTVLIVLIVVVAIRKIVVKKEARLNPADRAALAACASGVMPIVALQLSGTNHLLRYLCPAVIPFAMAIGILANTTGWIRSKTALAVSGTLAAAQVLILVIPAAFPNRQPVDPGFYNGGLPWRIMVRFEQWDLKPLRVIAQDCGLEKPRIAFLGMGRPLNPPQILYPWYAAGVTANERNGFPQPEWLWRFEQGPFDWRHVMSSAEQSDMLLTAPTFIGQATDRQNIDNQYNREFAAKLASDLRFRGPIRLQVGRFEPVELLVFLRNDIACHASTAARTEQ